MDERMETCSPLRLDLGAGVTKIDGYTPIDRNCGLEAYPLDYEDGEVDEIRASHILEHFDHLKTNEVVNHWVTKLKPGGLLRIAVPDFEWIARNYLDGKPINVQGYVMGGLAHENDRHGAIFDRETLMELMANAGLERLGSWRSEVNDCASMESSVNVQGFKPSSDERQVRDVVAVLSAPRYGPVVHARCAFQAFGRFGVPYQIGQGAFWHQTLSEMIEKQLETSAKYVLTLDYDTIFDADDLLHIYRLQQTYPDMDALCAVQTRRCGDRALFTIADEDGKPVKQVFAARFACNVTRINTGHFGFTLFRADALRDFPRPWMVPVPDKNGRWSDGRCDADMEFWRKWKEHKKSLYLAPRVVVGHMEEIIAWPGKDYMPVHQSLTDYARDGIPAEAVR